LAEPHEQSPLERFCALLADHDVEFIVVGGQAEALMGSPRVTYDVDLCYRRSPDNLEKLATALGTLNLRLRDAPPELKFRLDAQALALGQNYTFEVDNEFPLSSATWSPSGATTSWSPMPKRFPSVDGRSRSSDSTT
jgi:hypothetical protein